MDKKNIKFYKKFILQMKIFINGRVDGNSE